MESGKVVKTLNKLLETTKDAKSGFRTCAGAVTNPNLKTIFEDAARRCDEGAVELEAKIRGLGEEPDIRHSYRYATSRLDQHQVFDHRHGRICSAYRMSARRRRCKGTYEEALNEDLPGEVRALVQRQYEGVKKNHDRIRDLRNQAALKTAHRLVTTGSSAPNAPMGAECFFCASCSGCWMFLFR